MKIMKYLLGLFVFLVLINSGFSALTDNITAYWTHDNANTAGTISIDVTGNGYNGTLYNGVTTGTIGIINESYSFDGIDDYVLTTLGGNFDDFTISVWVTDIDTTIANKDIFSSLATTNDNRIILRSYYGKPTLVIQAQGGTTLVLTDTYTLGSSFTHWVVTRQGSTIKFYINGINTLTNNSFTDLQIQNLQNIPIGARHDYSGVIDLFYKGNIDEVAVWDRALNYTEIQKLYNNGTGLQYPFESAQPQINFVNISLQDGTITNTPYLEINVTVENISTNSNINISYSLNGGSYIQFVTNNLIGTLDLNLTDGLYNITFYAWNNETNATSDTIYFEIDTFRPNITRTNITEINTYTINVSTLFTYNDTHLDTCYVIIEGNQIGCEDSYTFTYNGNQSIEVYVNDSAGNENSLTFYLLVNPYQYFRFKDENGTYITNYYVDSTFVSGEYFIVKLLDYINTNTTFEFSKAGYVTSSFTVEFTNTSAYNVTYTIPYALINISIYDRETRELITLNATIKISGPTVIQGNTSIGNFVYSDLTMPSGDYLLEVFVDGYTTERKEFVFSNQEELNIKVYPLNKSSLYYGVIQVIVLDQYQNRVANAKIKLLEYDYDLNGFLEVWEDRTNSNGEAFIPVELSQKRYIIRIIDPISGKSYDSSTTGEVFYVDADTRTYIIQSGSVISRDTFIEGIHFSYIVNETLKKQNKSLIYVSYTDSTGLLEKMCLEYFEVQGLRRTKLENLTKCIESSSGSFWSDIIQLNLSKKNYEVEIVGYKDNQRILFTTIYYNSANSFSGLISGLGIEKIIILFLYILSISLLFITNMVPVGVFALIGTTLITNILFPSIITGVVSSFIILILIGLIYSMSRRE